MFDFGWLAEILFFAVKTAIILILIVIALALIFGNKQRDLVDNLNIENSNELFDYLVSLRPETKKKTRKEKKLLKKSNEARKDYPNLYVLDFKGDMLASKSADFAMMTKAIRLMSKENDEVLCKVSSPGGTVTGYGYMASLLQSLRNDGRTVTVAIDQVAASGGYLMASASDHIIAAPFAFVGSVGVVMESPNFNKLLKKVGVDYYEITAGEDKRAFSPLGEVTDEKIAKTEQQLKEIHEQFVQLIVKNRPKVNQSKIRSARVWTAEQSLELGLVDELMTADDWQLTKRQTHNIFSLSMKQPKPINRLLNEAATISEKLNNFFVRNS